MFAIAFADPHYFTTKPGVTLPEDQNPPSQGIAIYLIADESGSMMGEVNAKSTSGRYEKMAKIDFDIILIDCGSQQSFVEEERDASGSN